MPSENELNAYRDAVLKEYDRATQGLRQKIEADLAFETTVFEGVDDGGGAVSALATGPDGSMVRGFVGFAWGDPAEDFVQGWQDTMRALNPLRDLPSETKH